MTYGPPVLIGLGAIMALVLVLPFSVRWVEEELEAFLLVMGAAAVTMNGGWNHQLLLETLREPLRISAAVLLFGFVFRSLREAVRSGVSRWSSRLGMPAFLFAVVVVLGLASSVVTAIISALILVETVSALNLDEESEKRTVILACYSIGLGAALTPIGGPASAIATARLAGPPHQAGFFFLAKLLWPWLLVGIAALGAIAACYGGRSRGGSRNPSQDGQENGGAILLRSLKIYAFVAALILLGGGLSPLADRWIIRLPASALYWANISSAALDNATLAAAEISPRLDAGRIRTIMLALLVSGGMLIPGNIPNIISAGKLGIKSRQWARFAVPWGAALMTAYFVALHVVGH